MATETTIACPKCGAGNPSTADRCKVCRAWLYDAGGQPSEALQRIMAQPAPSAPAEDLPSEGRGVAGAISVVAVVVAVGIAGWVINLMVSSDRASAVQVSQVYTQGAFWLLFVIVLLLAGILWTAAGRR